jgi:hypothetical protein
MRDLFYKLMPGGLGLLLGWALFNPPQWMRALGPAAWGVNVGICALLLLSGVAWIILSNLPETMSMKPASDHDVHGDLRALGKQIEALGFRPVGPPYRVQTAPSAILLGYVHDREPVYATAYRTEHVRPRTAFDFVSMLHGDRGGLTTNAEPEGAVLPAGCISLRQVFPGEAPEALFRRHLEGIAYLGERRISCRPVSADLFQTDFVGAMARQRALFLHAPLKNTLLTLWRAGTRRVPFVGALSAQKIAGRQIEQLLARS